MKNKTSSLGVWDKLIARLGRQWFIRSRTYECDGEVSTNFWPGVLSKCALAASHVSWWNFNRCSFVTG